MESFRRFVLPYLLTTLPIYLLYFSQLNGLALGIAFSSTLLSRHVVVIVGRWGVEFYLFHVGS
jgi:hypothetical protein